MPSITPYWIPPTKFPPLSHISFPSITFAPLTPQRQIKYNGTLSELTIITLGDIRIYKHLVSEAHFPSANTCVFDIDTPFSKYAFELISKHDDLSTALLFFAQDYGVDIFNVHQDKISVAEFKSRCTQLAKIISVEEEISITVVFAQKLFPCFTNLNTQKDETC